MPGAEQKTPRQHPAGEPARIQHSLPVSIALELAKRIPKLGLYLQRFGAALLVLWPFLISFALMWMPTSIEEKLNQLVALIPLPDLLIAIAIVALLVSGCSFGAFWILHLGKRLNAREQALAHSEDERAPVVYLRPFAADESAHVPFRDRMAVVGRNILSNIEEQLAAALDPVGPLQAIGSPNEELPAPGAIRRYVDDAHWQSIVDEWVQAARLVIVRPGLSEGLWWELVDVRAHGHPERLLILAIGMRFREYHDFAQRLAEQLGITLPAFSAVSRWRSVSGFFDFDATWHARFLPLKAPLLRKSAWTPLQAPFNHALRPVFERLGVAWRPSPISPWQVFMMATGVLALTLTILLLLFA